MRAPSFSTRAIGTTCRDTSELHQETPGWRMTMHDEGWYLALVGRGRGGDEVGVEGDRPLAVGVGHLAHDLEEHAAHLLLLLGPQLLEVHRLLLLLEDVEGLLVVPRRQLEPRPAHLPRVDAHVDVDVGELLAVVEILPVDRQEVLHLGQVRQRLHRVCVCRVACRAYR